MSDDEDGYSGPAVLLVEETEFAVVVILRGVFEPVDGRYHWYGRVQVNEALTAALGGRKGSGALRTPFGETPGTLSDPDTWGRYRITGTSRPPFEVPTRLEDLPAGS